MVLVCGVWFLAGSGGSGGDVAGGAGGGRWPR